MKRITILLLIAVTALQAFAYNLTGKVLDDKDLQPLP